MLSRVKYPLPSGSNIWKALSSFSGAAGFILFSRRICWICGRNFDRWTTPEESSSSVADMISFNSFSSGTHPRYRIIDPISLTSTDLFPWWSKMENASAILRSRSLLRFTEILKRGLPPDHLIVYSLPLDSIMSLTCNFGNFLHLISVAVSIVATDRIDQTEYLSVYLFAIVTTRRL